MPSRIIAAGSTLLLLIAACSSAAPAASNPAAATSAAGTSATPGAVATPPASAASQGPFVMPSFAGDPDLAARYPKIVAGNPVTQVTTLKLIDFLHAFNSTQAEIDTMSQSFATIGMDLNSVILGSGIATVDGSTVDIFAYKIPGQDVTKMIQNYGAFAASNEGDKLSAETVGGKNVTVVRNNGYASTWMYPTGDILWTINSSSQKEAEAVFAALPS
jgi:hypothetical protein